MDADVFAERLAKVRNRFSSTLKSEIDETDAALAGWSGDGDPIADGVAETYRRLHGIAGTGPTIGFTATGRAARDAEAVLIPANRDRRALTAEEIASLKNALHALRQAATVELQAKQ